MAKILVIDDEKSIRNTLREILEFEGHEIQDAADGAEGLKKIESERFDLILSDIKMPKIDGLELLERSLELQSDTPVVMISGHGTIETAVEAIKKGAFDFIAKPLDLNRLLVTLRNALDRNVLIKETKQLRKKAGTEDEIIGQSDAILKIKEMVDRVASTDARVLITGENGTGKELIARKLHRQSTRNGLPLIEVNCAAIPSELIESELFGHEKGAFTSAIKQRIGKFEQAHNGTLFLDEIGDMSLGAQAKVLRALQENKITRVGGEKEISVDVRIIAATNKDLREEIKQHRFREDLYHRLSVILLHAPPLRERKGDVSLIANHFLIRICSEHKVGPKRFEAAALKALEAMPWTGNIRELRNVVERLVILGGNEITAGDVKQFAGNQ
ncbi:MAG: sigma-54-dependent transcriptional regulator [Bacteroidota bacterium]|jgi:two-component system nitrogen regulation response regulator NtrX